jgi:hypothetical protein
MRVVPADDASSVGYNMGSLQPFLMLRGERYSRSRNSE